jgi:type IV secretion system protein TrbI
MSATSLPPPPLALPAPARHKVRLKMTAFIAAGVLAVGAILLAWEGFYSMAEDHAANMQSDTHTSSASASPEDILKNAPTSNERPAFLRPRPATRPASHAMPAVQAPSTTMAPTPDDMTDAAIAGRRAAWTAYYQQLGQLQQTRMEARIAAMEADTEPTETNPGSNANANTAGGGANGVGQAGQGGGNGLPGGIASGLPGGQGGTHQDSQRNFLASNGSNPATDYSPFMPTAPLSPYELKVTDIITGKLVSALNSDAPGMVKAIVTKNVLDHATGNHILIPQGSVLAGIYDTNVAYGQHRVVVAWQRIIFPPPCDQSLDLGSMPGSDQTGEAGFKDLTDNHLSQIFGNALLVAVFGAGIQLSQPPQSSFSTYSPMQTAAGGIGQQLGQLGEQFASKGLRV